MSDVEIESEAAVLRAALEPFAKLRVEVSSDVEGPDAPHMVAVALGKEALSEAIKSKLFGTVVPARFVYRARRALRETKHLGSALLKQVEHAREQALETHRLREDLQGLKDLHRAALSCEGVCGTCIACLEAQVELRNEQLALAEQLRTTDRSIAHQWRLNADFIARRNLVAERLLEQARAGVARYINAQGRHLDDPWRAHLIECCALTIDEGNPHRPAVAGAVPDLSIPPELPHHESCDKNDPIIRTKPCNCGKDAYVRFRNSLDLPTVCTACGLYGAPCDAHAPPMSEIERALRREYWFHHGCGDIAGLYGDDGEMQCGNCRIDFRRTPIGTLMGQVTAARVAAAARATSGGGGR